MALYLQAFDAVLVYLHPPSTAGGFWEGGQQGANSSFHWAGLKGSTSPGSASYFGAAALKDGRIFMSSSFSH